MPFLFLVLALKNVNHYMKIQKLITQKSKKGQEMECKCVP